MDYEFRRSFMNTGRVRPREVEELRHWTGLIRHGRKTRSVLWVVLKRKTVVKETITAVQVSIVPCVFRRKYNIILQMPLLYWQPL